MWLFKQSNWSNEEIKNQFVHFGLAIFITSFVNIFTKNIFTLVFFSFGTGIVIELYQYIGKNERTKEKVYDHIRDAFAYLIGALLYLIWKL
jgi:Na+/H+-dicarboxylate symporter